MVSLLLFLRNVFGFMLCVLLLGGCAGPREKVAHDPWEGFNRSVYVFNDTLDKYALEPLAKGYRAVTPDPVETGIGNFFSNLGDVGSFFNNLLQFKFTAAGHDLSRIAFNSTMGVAGFFDVASGFGYPKSNEDFGQTLGAWGVNSGPYIVLPFLGPSTLRDTGALPVSYFLNPVNYVESSSDQNILTALGIVKTRAQLLKASSVRDTAALDPYLFTREAFLQRRASLVRDGQPAKEDEDLDKLLDE